MCVQRFSSDSYACMRFSDGTSELGVVNEHLDLQFSVY